MSREKNLEAIFVISLGLIVFFLIFEIRLLLTISLFNGILGLFLSIYTTWIAKAWYGLSHIMGFVMSKVILTLVFYIFLFPMAMITKLRGKITLNLKKSTGSYWTERNYVYKKEDVENMW